MTKLVRNHAHWGAFLAEVEDGRVVGVRPFEHDPDPSPMIQAVPAAVHSQTGSAQPVTGPLTSWLSIARHAKLMVLFGGCNPKNMQVTKGGCAGHFNGDRLAELVRNGVDVVTISPNREDGPAGTAPEWIAIRP